MRNAKIEAKAFGENRGLTPISTLNGKPGTDPNFPNRIWRQLTWHASLTRRGAPSNAGSSNSKPPARSNFAVRPRQAATMQSDAPNGRNLHLPPPRDQHKPPSPHP